ncbi:MAG: hypothetical protein U9P63_01275 [Patescibacteria group bacterium]|nr:hypothetical protein [Patescibacteria group bacterium]
MIIKLGPRTFSIPSARLPKLDIPQFRFMSWLSVPIPKALRIGGAKMGLTSLVVVAIGFAGTIFMVVAGTDSEMLWPETGAVYSLPNTVGEPLPPDPETPDQVSHTLVVKLADKTRLDKLVLKNLDLGKESLSESFSVERSSGVTGSLAYLWVGAITITGSSAPTLAWDNMEVGSISLAARVDGHTQEMTVDSTIPVVIIDSDRGAGTYTAENSVVDRVVISMGTNGATIGELIIEDVDASVGAWDWDYIKAGSISMDSTNSFGNGTGINSSSASFGSDIKARIVTDNLVDTPISVK